ncbi:MAG: glycerophosphodiester phosphodiesterase family protein [Fibrobacterota bacterium]
MRTALFVHTVIGRFEEYSSDIFAFRRSPVDASRIRLSREHGYELHVWTGNDSQKMHRFIALGVDNILTDFPYKLTQIMETHKNFSQGELALIRMGNLIW